MNIKSNKLNKAIKCAISEKESNNYVELGIVDEKTAKIIYKLTGIKVNNRIHVMYFNDIRHTLNQHGDNKEEIKKGQLAINKNDLLRIPNILYKYDYIKIGAKNREGKTIRYIKEYTNDCITIVEVLPKKKSLKIKTMWKTALDDNQSPHLNAQSASSKSTLINKNITNIKKEVK